MECNILKKEFVLPKPDSPKKQWLYTFECSKCGRIDSRWYRKGSFTGICRHCSRGRYTTEQFIQKCKEVHGDFYDYSKAVYKNKRSKVIIICPIHGEFSTRAGDFMNNKSRCPECSKENRVSMITITREEWQKRLTERFPHISLVSTDIGYHSKATFHCEIHGEFQSYIGSITNAKYLCPHCLKDNKRQAQSIRPTLVGSTALLYYVYLPEIDMYKLGVTTQPLENRLRGYEYDLQYSESLEYNEACKIEHEIHSQLVEKRYKGRKKLIKNGSTELYKTDILSFIQHNRAL